MQTEYPDLRLASSAPDPMIPADRSPLDRDSADIDHHIRADRTHHLYMGSMRAQLFALLAGALLALGLHGSVPDAALASWIGAMVVIMLWLTVLRRAYLRQPQPVADPARWEQRFWLEITSLGLVWAALPLGLLPSRPDLAIVAMVTLLGVITATLSVLGVSPVFYGFVLPPMLSLAAACAVRAEAGYLALAALVLIDLLFLIGEQRHLRRQREESVRTRLANDELVAQVQRARTALAQSLADQQALFDLASVGIVEIRDRTIVRANRCLEQMLLAPPGSLVGQSSRVFFSGDEAYHAFGSSAQALQDGVPYEGDMPVRRHDGSVTWVHLFARALDPAEPRRGMIGVFSDISDRREREAAILRLSQEDALTGLPNRRLLDDRLQQALRQALRREHVVALLLVDLDGFKNVNDTHGHAAGDEVLVTVARRLVGCVRASDTVARLGGDEFVVLLNQPVLGADAQLVAQKIIQAVAEPIVRAGVPLQVGASIGIALHPQDAADAEGMMRAADIAMYRAKQAGRGTWAFYGPPKPLFIDGRYDA